MGGRLLTFAMSALPLSPKGFRVLLVVSALFFIAAATCVGLFWYRPAAAQYRDTICNQTDCYAVGNLKTCGGLWCQQFAAKLTTIQTDDNHTRSFVDTIDYQPLSYCSQIPIVACVYSINDLERVYFYQPDDANVNGSTVLMSILCVVAVVCFALLCVLIYQQPN